MRAVWVQCDVLTAEKASMASGLEAKECQMGSMQQEHTRLQDQLLICQERVSQLQSELLQVLSTMCVPCAASLWYYISMQQEHTCLQDQLLLCQERVAQLQSDLLQVLLCHAKYFLMLFCMHIVLYACSFVCMFCMHVVLYACCFVCMQEQHSCLQGQL